MGTLSRIAGKISIAALARRQHGFVTRVQLLDAGLSSSAIGRRVDAGALIPSLHTGVYAVGHLPPHPVSGAAAAVLACGRGAALSHASAATLWGFGGHRWGTPVHVTMATDCRRRGIRIHRVKALSRRDVTTHRGIRVTTPARTLLDVAPALTDRALTRAVNDALISNYLHESELLDILERLPRQRGARRLAAVALERTRSSLEDEFGAFAARFGLPKPLFNTVVNGREVDILFPEQRLIVELDGWHTHRTRAAFEDDRDRDAEMLKTGLPTVRITRDRLIQDPAREAARLLTILRARSHESLTDL